MSLLEKSFDDIKPRSRKYILPSRSLILPTPLKFEPNLKILWIFSVLFQIPLHYIEKLVKYLLLDKTMDNIYEIHSK